MDDPVEVLGDLILSWYTADFDERAVIRRVYAGQGSESEILLARQGTSAAADRMWRYLREVIGPAVHGTDHTTCVT